jgi:uncharacterized protein (DUF362 family)
MVEVAIVKGENPQTITENALEMVEAEKALVENKPVLVKPNYLNAKHPSTGITTDARVVEGVIQYLRRRKVGEIIVGEGSGFADTFEAFKVAGIDVMAEKWGVKLVDLNKDRFVEVSPSNPLALERVKVAETALKTTIISVAKLKPHRITTVTLSLKNMMGAVYPKGSMHFHLHKKIADLASILKPSVAVIDGVIAGEGHEASESPVKMDLVIAGTDPVAVDSVGAAVMGVDPMEVKHLRYAEEKGLGTCDMKRIKILGEPLEMVRRKFKRSILTGILSHLG